ncbi:alternative ribosome rescue aminoacyl-tRNA hydrolase ArfB [Pelobium manganitolerans]|uniref:alternative ribosome rescue aminoacyl-tRNA hydrolase ArfB n=1 Tax=Pelobium manganitolerans TaxID=1842495 RepID=UPI003FA3593C
MANLVLIMNFDEAQLQKEFSFRTARSGGKGGQNVNKVETKVELLWYLAGTAVFTEVQMKQLQSRLKHRINSEGVFSVTASEARSQLQNREIAVSKALALIKQALLKQKVRKATKPNKLAVQKRLETKKKQALKKISRNKNFDI